MPIILLKKRRLTRAESALLKENYALAYKLSIALVTDRKNEIAHRANNLCGLALYKKKKYTESVNYLDVACQKGNFRHDWYNLAMALAFAGEVEKAETAFNTIYRTNVQPGYLHATSVPKLLFQYFKVLKKNGFIQPAKVRAMELEQMYAGVGSDQSKHIQRGLPPYAAFKREFDQLQNSTTAFAK